MKTAILAALAALTLAPSAPALAASSACADAATVLAGLQKGYHETVVWVGETAAANYGLALTQSPGGETWTLMIAHNGQLCSLLAGTNAVAGKALQGR